MPDPAVVVAVSAAPAAPGPGRPTPARETSGPQRALAKLGLVRDIDFALHLPIRYEDETRRVPVAALRDGMAAQVEGVVTASEVQVRSRRQLVVHLGDDAGDTLILRFLHFYPSSRKTLAVGRRVRVRGEARGGFFGLEMVHPSVQAVDAATPLPTTLTPVYPTTAQLPQNYLRKAVVAALARADLSPLLPDDLVPPDLPALSQALALLHRPPPGSTPDDREQPAWQRLKFEELVAQQVSQLEAQRERAGRTAPRFDAPRGGLHERLLAALPFALTEAQRRVGEEIARDLGRPTPMHRLLQGDVGSGKTVVAALAASIAIEAGWQCALMAPTEILAEQHLRKLVGWLAPLGVTVAWLTGSRKGRARREMEAQVASGDAALVVGTHAMIQESVDFARLGLAIVDEQHRFGVRQRLALRAKLAAGELEPHTLMMTATPIPRTLAMTFFADLEVSTIDELPPGRTPVLTKLFSDERRAEVVERIRVEVAAGRQVYWVCPLIEESEALDLQNATATHEHLTAALPDVRVALLHGRMPPAEKAAAMALFAAGQVAVLVATTVIEVGVDVPNASLMVIEHAERFGLSQLHQLRGRVGRGREASVCVLLYGSPLSPTAKERLRAMRETADGFEIARRDLALRGPGEILGARQSGATLLRFADLAKDEALVATAHAVAVALLARSPETARAHVERWLGARADFLNA